MSWNFNSSSSSNCLCGVDILAERVLNPTLCLSRLVCVRDGVVRCVFCVAGSGDSGVLVLCIPFYSVQNCLLAFLNLLQIIVTCLHVIAENAFTQKWTGSLVSVCFSGCFASRLPMLQQLHPMQCSSSKATITESTRYICNADR